MTAKHTPGEWFSAEPDHPDLRQIEDRLIYAIVDGEKLYVAEVYQYQNDNHREPNGTALANADLIKSSPALLAACKLAESVLTHPGISNVQALHFGENVVKQIQSAIEAGEGK